MKPIARVFALLAFAAAGAASAADFDGSKPLICAAQEAKDCVAGERCESGLPGDFGLPTFMRVDFAKKAIVGAARTTTILTVDKSADQVLLMGTELGYAWTIAIDAKDGAMSGTVNNREGVFAMFGACTPN